MSRFKIKNISGDNNVFGDKNRISNSVNEQDSVSVLTRNDYFLMIEELIDLQRMDLDNYLENKFSTHVSRNPNFVKLLYIDVFTVLQGVQENGGDFEIVNGDFILEYGDIKLSGQPNNLHYAMVWLHMKLIAEFTKDGSINAIQQMEGFENDFLNVNNNSLRVSNRIEELRGQLKDDLVKKKWSWKDLYQAVELKPEWMGLSIDVKMLLSKLFSKQP